MTPTPEICKNCRHGKSIGRGLAPKHCLVWGNLVLADDDCQHFESREQPSHFQQLHSWLKKFDEVQARTAKSKLQLP